MTALREQISAIEDDVAQGKHTAMSLFTLMRQFIKTDAEGDDVAVGGDAVAWQRRDLGKPHPVSGKRQWSHWREIGMHEFDHMRDYKAENPSRDDIEVRRLFPQPVRSGVVSDEQVAECIEVWNASPALGREEDYAAMRATLEHFAKSQGESNV